jgi:hypothetical protein
VVTIFAMPEYVAVGPKRDFLRIPMNLYTARGVADRFQFTLPTRKLLDAIYDQSQHHSAAVATGPPTVGPNCQR